MAEIRAVQFPTLEEAQRQIQNSKPAVTSRPRVDSFASRKAATAAGPGGAAAKPAAAAPSPVAPKNENMLKLYHPHKAKVTVHEKLGQFIDVKI